MFLFLCNVNYRSERKVTQRGSIAVIRKKSETTGRHIPKPKHPQQLHRACVCQHVHKRDPKRNASS